MPDIVKNTDTKCSCSDPTIYQTRTRSCIVEWSQISPMAFCAFSPTESTYLLWELLVHVAYIDKMTSWHILPCSLFICSIVYREVWILVWSSLDLYWFILQSHNLLFLFRFYVIWHRLKCQLKLKTSMGTFERVWLFNGVLRLLLWHTIKLPLFGRIVFLDASYWCLIQPYSHCYRRPSLLSRKEHTCWSMDVEGSRNFVPSGFPMWVY